MENLTIYQVHAKFTESTGKEHTRSSRMYTTYSQAREMLQAMRNTYKNAQAVGAVKYFTLYLQEQHLEPGKEA